MAATTKQQRREQILKTARATISQKGADQLNMKELAREAGVPRASLYRIYTSKEHIISDLTLEWGLNFTERLKDESQAGNTRGERIASVFRSILLEAEENPMLIGAVLANILSTDDKTRNMQIQFEALLPAALSMAVDCETIPDATEVMDVLLRLLLSNLQMLSSGRSDLDESLSQLVFAAERLMGREYWDAD